VKLQIQKYLPAFVLDQAHHLWSAMQKKLFADFKETNFVGEQRDIFFDFSQGSDIQGEDEALFRPTRTEERKGQERFTSQLLLCWS